MINCYTPSFIKTENLQNVSEKQFRKQSRVKLIPKFFVSKNRFLCEVHHCIPLQFLTVNNVPNPLGVIALESVCKENCHIRKLASVVCLNFKMITMTGFDFIPTTFFLKRSTIKLRYSVGLRGCFFNDGHISIFLCVGNLKACITSQS